METKKIYHAIDILKKLSSLTEEEILEDTENFNSNYSEAKSLDDEHKKYLSENFETMTDDEKKINYELRLIILDLYNKLVRITKRIKKRLMIENLQTEIKFGEDYLAGKKDIISNN